MPRHELLQSLAGRLSVPVVTAGGIATAGQVATALRDGAAAVRIGTRFVACTESSAHPEYVAALISAVCGDETVVTTAFAVGWPDAPHRVLRSAVQRAESFPGDEVGFVMERGQRHPVQRFAVSTPHKDMQGEISAMAMYAGTGVGEVTGSQSAADIVADLVSEVPAG